MLRSTGQDVAFFDVENLSAGARQAHSALTLFYSRVRSGRELEAEIPVYLS